MEQGTLLRQTEGGYAKAGEGRVFPIFTREAVHNETKSLEAGRPIYDTVEMVTFVIPGDPGTQPQRLVSERDKIEYSEAYSRFKNEEAMQFDGTPIDAWPRLTVGQVASLKHLGFFTVESLANCSDANITKLGMGGYMLRDQARAYIEAAKTGGVPERLVAENAQLRTDMEGLQATITELRHIIEKMARENKVDVAKIETPVANALSHARETIKSQPGDLPDGWRDMKVKQLIELCQALDMPITPRNREEALQLLGEYEGRRAALR